MERVLLKKGQTVNRIFFYSLLFLFFLGFISCSGGGISRAESVWKSLPVQHQGRVKPFDTFSREILRKVYGKESYKKRSAVEVILSWLIVPSFWENTRFILIEGKEIKQSLGLSLKLRHFSPSELRGNQKLALQLVELKSLKQRKERLDSYFQNLEKLETRLILYAALKTGFLIRIEPQKDKKAMEEESSSGLGEIDARADKKTWLSLPEMTKPAEEQFTKLISKYVQLISKSVSLPYAKNPEGSVKSPQKDTSFNFSQDQDESSLAKGRNTSEELSPLFSSFKDQMAEFQNVVFGAGETKAFQPFKIQVEIFYNSLKPFQKAWIFYFLFLLALLTIYVLKWDHFFKWLIPLAVIGFSFHSLGLLLRSYIMSRPPVSNMYETVVWVPWVALVAGSVFYFRGSKLPFIASVLLSCFCLFLINLAPDILDGSLQPLEAVLNSSFWLSTHVIIITMSYSFFFMAFVLGDMALVSYLVRKSQPLSLIKKMYGSIYRTIQWGVLFLAGGTILGGIWADYSWGRFWGWDPKESWALVSLLAYLALLHGKLVGWIKPFGMAIGAVMMFFLVIMAWYGVNFVLGAGLHTYGFGSGGVEYVSGFLFLHLLLCGLALFKRFQLHKNEGHL